MQQAWLKGLKETERDSIKRLVQNNKILLDKLKEICYNRRIELEAVREVDYDSPAWSHKQAHKNGLKDALLFVETMCTLRDE